MSERRDAKVKDKSDRVTRRVEFTLPGGDALGTKTFDLKAPTLGQLLDSKFPERRHLLSPWLKQQETVMVYAETGVGKSMFAASVALAVAGGGEFLGWRPKLREGETGYRVLYVDGEMHVQDIQDRMRVLTKAVPGLDLGAASGNLRFLARQHQRAGAEFPSITEPGGMRFYLDHIEATKPDLVILDNFTTLGEVEDENAASSFNAVQAFLLGLKTCGVATILVHHAGKSGDFRGSSKLAATFETIVSLERPGEDKAMGEAQFRVTWDKVRAGGAEVVLRPILAKLVSHPGGEDGEPLGAAWEYEAGDLERLEEVRQMLQRGEFKTQSEIADFYGVSRQAVSKWAERAERMGLWTDDKLRRWLAKGKQLRGAGRTHAPVRPDAEDGECGPF